MYKEEMSEQLKIDHEKHKSKKLKKSSIVIHILVAIFGMSTWICVNGIFIQLPYLIMTAPENLGLVVYLVITVQVSNIVPILYSLIRKSTKLLKNEKNTILLLLGVDWVLVLLLAYTYNITITIFSSKFSVMLIIITFIISGISCTTSILFLPYLKNFDQIYLASYFVGEGLSGFLPSIIALLQGSPNKDSNCKNNTMVENVEYVNNHVRFSPRDYFTFLSMLLLLSFSAFLILSKIKFIRNKTISLDDYANYHLEEKIKERVELNQTELNEVLVIDHEDQKEISLNYKIYFYTILGLTCFLSNSFLPTLQPISSYSYGIAAYHYCVIFSQIANPIACFLALWLLPEKVKIINLLTIVIFILSSYIIYLAMVSSSPPLKNVHYSFFNLGKLVLILIWMFLIGFIAYLKLLITSMFQKNSKNGLYNVGIIIQISSVIGAIITFIIFNFTPLFEKRDLCQNEGR